MSAAHALRLIDNSLSSVLAISDALPRWLGGTVDWPSQVFLFKFALVEQVGISALILIPYCQRSTIRNAGEREDMKIVIIGGGAAGLYYAVLMKKADPSHDISVYERNRADETYGFGVVFSDETLGNFLSHDPTTYDEITRAFAYWDEIDFV